MNTHATQTGEPQGGSIVGRAGIVVGVDGSSNNLSAVDWAADKALRTGSTLRAVIVNDKRVLRTPQFASELPDPFDAHAYAEDIVERVADKARHDHPGLAVEPVVVNAASASGLLDEGRKGAVTVVGQRGIGLVRRVLAGSMSIALAGRSTSPVVVVPDTWQQADHTGESVLVGVDLGSDSGELLAFAFAQAQELGVPLVALHVWETHPAITHDPEDVARWSLAARSAVDAALEPWRAKFPDVEALAAAERAHLVEGLLDAAENAQLLVLGRKSAGGSPLGLGISSLVRSVLHASTRPVAVVPTKHAA